MLLSRREQIVVGSILIILVCISLLNFSQALRRRRDAQRVSDLKAVSQALTKFHEDFGFYPPDRNGRILSCGEFGLDSVNESQGADNIQKSGYQILQENASECEWGNSRLADLSDPNYPAYMATIPRDPLFESGWDYVYDSTGKNFQLMASLESSEEVEYHAKLLSRQVNCGEVLCNHSTSSLQLPLEKSLLEYENELLEASGK